MSSHPRIDETLDIIPRWGLIAFTGFLGEYNTTYLIAEQGTSLGLLNANVISIGIMVASVMGFAIQTFKIYLTGKQPTTLEEFTNSRIEVSDSTTLVNPENKSED
jgi:hypothetical protein